MFDTDDFERFYSENRELVDAAIEGNERTKELIKRDPKRWAKDLAESVFRHHKDGESA